MIINNTPIGPGQNAIIRLLVGRLPTDTRIHLNVHVYRSVNPGPVVLLMAGVHGDEINSVEIVRRCIAQKMLDNLQRGSVIAIPVLNIYGFNNFSRDVPDGKDVNRSFPGSAKGSLASRVAFVFTKNILPLIDHGVDFHTGGSNNYNFPQIRYTASDMRSKELAAAFSAPFTIATSTIPKSLRKAARDAGKSVIVFEGGENLRFDGFAIEKGIAGVHRLLHSLEMLPDAPPSDGSIFIQKRTWMRASRPGMFRWWKKSGQMVRKGEPLGVINDPYGQEEVPILAAKDGYIIGHNNAPVVGPGDALFHIGY
ncbi:MAG: succinylglutamate desuccinylase/aspartoacylase family protein [Lewinellaceae bacterium]|nr:succinylglutamate desuccinylase/aspartoacylase family protein [Saprospiraceae bacterium]MCB9338677.1 succinylglutamate desuccinylase/aspartoacylase family protein [Lewinellaceae bacterium]